MLYFFQHCDIHALNVLIKALFAERHSVIKRKDGLLAVAKKKKIKVVHQDRHVKMQRTETFKESHAFSLFYKTVRIPHNFAYVVAYHATFAMGKFSRNTEIFCPGFAEECRDSLYLGTSLQRQGNRQTFIIPLAST